MHALDNMFKCDLRAMAVEICKSGAQRAARDPFVPNVMLPLTLEGNLMIVIEYQCLRFEDMGISLLVPFSSTASAPGRNTHRPLAYTSIKRVDRAI